MADKWGWLDRLMSYDPDFIGAYPCQSCKLPFKTRTGLANHPCYPRTKRPEVKPAKWVGSEELRQAIRDDYATGSYSYRNLAEKYGVSAPTIGSVVKGKNTSRLSEESRQRLYEDYYSGRERNYSRLSEKYGVSVSTATRIVRDRMERERKRHAE